MELLRLESCQHLCIDWCFHHITSAEELLEQLDPTFKDWPYLHMHAKRGRSSLHALGVGSNRRVQERVGRLGLSLASLLREGSHQATKSADLYEPFSRFGKVIDAVMPWHKDTNKSKGLGFVEVADAAAVSREVECKSSQRDSSMITSITESTC